MLYDMIISQIIRHNKRTTMYSSSDFIIPKNKRWSRWFGYCDDNTLLSNNLYNAALYRIRQLFTGHEKSVRTPNEDEVFKEIETLNNTYPKYAITGRFFNYEQLEKLMRATNNPDFFAGLPMQSAQDVLKQALSDFYNWLAALRDYKENPSKYLAKPKMPHYKRKGGHCTYTISNQDAVLYPVDDTLPAGAMLKLPKARKFGIGSKSYIKLSHVPKNSKLKEVKIIPYHGRYKVSLTLDVPDIENSNFMPNIAGLDLGIDNIAAIVSTDGSACLYKGSEILSRKRLTNKNKASAVTAIMKGHDPETYHYAQTEHLKRLSLWDDQYTKDQLHKISRSIISYCVKHACGTLVIGYNRNWKQGSNMGTATNQKFVQLPHRALVDMISYKAELKGITVIETEEAYTSKADVTANDPVPVCDSEALPPVMSGRRKKRGLYVCHDGLIINADCNGAANIIRKVFPDVWAGIN